MKNLCKYISCLFCVLFLFPVCANAEHVHAPIMYRYGHHLFTIDPDSHSWTKTEEVWLYYGNEIQAPQHLRADGDVMPELPEGLVRTLRTTWDTTAIQETLQSIIGDSLNRPRGEVTITKSADGVAFEGVGFLGKEVDTTTLTRLTTEALAAHIYDIHIPVIERQPVIHVLSPDLQDMGIEEVLAIGESNYSGSPQARKDNIATGLSKFNGHLIERGATFSFNTVLGPVNAQTGYKKELVILGEKTLPDYGGGLCQVSTTAYRGIWEYGFPIDARRHHSFAVQYYSPQGTDATIYPPYTDMRFVNDGPSSILIQTHNENDRAYFIYYGLRDNRSAEVIGPYVWDRRPPPSDRVEYTTDIPAGTTRIAGKAVSGLKAAWFRIVAQNDEEFVEPYYSYYEARPNFTQIGGAAKPPSWIGEG